MVAVCGKMLRVDIVNSVEYESSSETSSNDDSDVSVDLNRKSKFRNSDSIPIQLQRQASQVSNHSTLGHRPSMAFFEQMHETESLQAPLTQTIAEEFVDPN